MKRGLAFAGIAVLGLGVAIAAVAIYVFASLDDIVKTAVEKHGTEAMGTTVTLDSVEIDLGGATGTLNGLIVGNPEGFNRPSAFQLGRIAMSLSADQSSTEAIHIREARITAPSVTYEFGQSGTNIAAIRKNVDAYTASGADESAAEGDGDGPGTRFIIDDIYVEDGSVAVAGPGMGDRELSAALPDIHLQDIGKDSDRGATPGEVASRLIDAIGQSAKRAVGKLDLSGITGVLKQGDAQGLETLKKSGEDAGTSVGDKVNDLLGD